MSRRRRYEASACSTPYRRLRARPRSPIRPSRPVDEDLHQHPGDPRPPPLAQATARQAKTTERIASGSRINSAADDAAGLSISEQLRGQIGGLRQATRNAQDAVSLLQTADGALGEVHASLQRVRTASRRSRSRSTRSCASARRFAVGVEPGLRAFEYYAKPFDTTIDMVSSSLGPDMHTPVTPRHSYAIPANASMEDVAAIINSDPDSPVEVTARYDGPNDSYAFGFYNKGDGTTFDTIASGAAIEEWPGYHDRYPGIDANPVFDFGDPDDIAQIDDAITAIAGYRGEFGATQTRIDQAVRSVLTQQENLTAGESRIRDADVGQEVVEMARAGILAHAATSVLAQANQAPQLVLSLLKS